MSERARAYRFKTRAQWEQCLVNGFDVAKSGSLQPIARLGATPRQLTKVGRVERIAADMLGGPIWRLHSHGTVALVRRNDFDEVSRPFEVDAPLAHAFRWVLDHHWLWTFDASAARRYERDTLSADLAIPQEMTVRDLAGDAHGGAWLLLEGTWGAWWLRHPDCEGRTRETHLVPRDAGTPTELGAVARGKRLVLLMSDRRLLLFDAATGDVIREIRHWSHGPCWAVDRLTTDSDNRIAILCHDSEHPNRWAVFMLDAEGDTLDVVEGPLPTAPPAHTPNDVAFASGVLWLAADDGVWLLDSSDASIARESESVLLTPRLLSPQTGTGDGWLRAEIDVDLPRGAVIEAQAATTDDDRIANQARDIAEDRTRTVAQRQQAIWTLLDHEGSRVFHLQSGQRSPVAVPLFGTTDRSLWLRLTIVTPPGITPPAITEMRVLYPDASIAQRLPAIFRGRENDPTGFVRSLTGVLETTTQSIDEQIRGIAGQIDPATAPAVWLDFIARWLDLPWDDGLPIESKRRIAQNAGVLLERRGTRDGLRRLLDALIGTPGRARIVDLTVDHPPMRIGGRDCRGGARLPLMLAGPAAHAPVLGVRAVLGRACLGVPCDPLRSIVPALRVAATAPRATRRVLEPLMGRVLAQYVPAGVNVEISWKVMSAALAVVDADEGEVLDANGPGRLGDDSEIGRVVISRRGAVAADDAGLDVGFRLS